MADQVIVVPTPINPVQIKGAIAYSAEHARIWAEGSDEQVEELGGEHSAKGWAESTGEEGREYTDQKVAEAKQEMTDEINRQSLAVFGQASDYADGKVADEASLRQQADNNLQSQIDAISAASDVFDIVGTYQELLEYDTSIVPLNDIIKVLSDSTHNDAATYYRWDGTQWVYIGSEGASYTKAESDTKFLSKTEAASTYVTQTDFQTELDAELATKASNADGSTITDNGTTITTIAVKEQNDNKAIKKWVGTKAQYDAIVTKDPYTTYYVTDEDDAALLQVDSELSNTSTNPVQNRVITAKIAELEQGSGNVGAPTLTWYTGNVGQTVSISNTSGAQLVKIYKNGILLEPTADYSISGTTLTLVTALVSTDKITVEVY